MRTTRTWRAVVSMAVLSIAACGKDSKCESVAAHMGELAKKAGKRVSAGDVDELAGKCKEGKWPEQARTCIMSAKALDDAVRCFNEGPPSDYAAKAKTSEAREFVKKLYDGARAFYLDGGYARGSLEPVPAHFPEVSVGPTPPLGACCAQGGKCRPDAMLWTDETWVQLQFSVDDPHYYSYQYEVIDPQKKFVVRAFGDLDCDGTYSTFEMVGEITPDDPDGPSGSVEVKRINELE